ncbi:MAG: hypothetical protein GX443_17835 [Deltaproteobacteria bacterium]|nr:hypothetical protein [Deltaproteobacteria bacterium]
MEGYRRVSTRTIAARIVYASTSIHLCFRNKG